MGTYKDTTLAVSEQLDNAHRLLVAALATEELTKQQREALTAIAFDLLDVSHKLADAWQR